MNIDRIYSRHIISAPRSSTLQEAALLMREYHVGALVVTDEEPNSRRAVGIVTDRDLVLRGTAEGITPEDGVLEEVMTDDISTISNDADTHEALETMRSEGVRRLVVTAADGTLVGIVSMDDIVDAIAAELASLTGLIRSERERELAQEPVAPALHS
jgi:CBS domain-containing protein